MLNEYAITVLKLSLFVGVALNLAHPKQEKVIRLSLGIILLSAVTLPFVDIIADNGLNLDLILPDEGIDVEVSDDAIEEAFEDGIREYICSSYGLSSSDVKVMADGFDLSSMTASRLYVTLSGKGAYVDYRALADHLAEEFTRGGECRIELDIG